MCGISGVFSIEDPPTRRELRDMNTCVEHRGPDADGSFLEPPVGLAHRRLSIVGLNSGDQPIRNEDGSVVVIFNGEIYNYPELAEQLRAAGHSFRTETDTEVLVHLYEEYGRAFVDRLDGMFAFALWDRDEEELLLARDPVGIKPLLVADDGDRIGFASELPSILRSDVDQGGLDERAISEYFAYGYVPAPRTAFENVEKVRPGESIVVSAEGLDRQQYHTPTVESVEDSFATASETLRELVFESVEKRLMSDVPLGTFLSGGIDSTILTGVMSQLQDRPVRTFTVGFERERFDESPLARRVAEYHSTDHTEYRVSAADVREAMPRVLGRLGEPFADPSLLPTYIVSRETSQDVKVALSGDGADELFAGYNRYRGEYYSSYYRRLPRAVRSMVVEPGVNRLPASRSSRTGELIRKGQKFVGVSAESDPHRHFEWVRKSPQSASRAYRDCTPAADGVDRMRREYDRTIVTLPDDRQQSLARMLAVDTQYGLPNQMLQKVDLASMYNSLEVRVPFLDSGVVEYALGLPLEYKITARSRKRILKAAFEDLIPKVVRTQPKRGFDMPIGEWFKNELREEFERLVTDVETPLIRADEVRSLLDEHCSGRRDHEWFLWTVYVFTHWYERMQSDGRLP
jgi:asparagine synthase (glutamine-hydrolysing)